MDSPWTGLNEESRYCLLYTSHPNAPYVAVKVPVFSFEKLHGVDTQFSPEMKSTGEVLGIAPNYQDVYKRQILGLAKGQLEPGYDADMVLVDLDTPYTVDKDKLHSKSHKMCIRDRP